MDLVGRTLAGRYELEEVIGRGGMSTVYRATDPLLGRTVAVKVLLASLADQDPVYAARFEREARAAAALASSAVVAVYDTGVDGGAQFIVMEFVRGQSLAAMLRDRRPLEIKEAVRIGEQVAGALSVAHAAGVLHRDIKPANVMIAEDGAVKVLDFGIAHKVDDTTLTTATSIIGTASYMAPERILGKSGDARADIYSLGCLLYAMLTGRPPFDAELAAALLQQQLNAKPTPPSKLRAGIPAALDALVLAMLAKSPRRRPQTVDEVSDRLSAVSAPARSRPGRKVAAAAATAPTTPLHGARDRTAATRVVARSRRWDRRWGAIAAVAAAALAIVVALASGGGSTAGSSTGARPPTRAASTAQTTSTPTSTPATTAPPQQTAPAAPAPVKHPKPGPAAGPPGHGGSPPGHHGKPGKPGKPDH